jgi:hypothetical protein
LEKALFPIAYCWVLRWVAATALLLKQVEKGGNKQFIYRQTSVIVSLPDESCVKYQY